MDDNVQFRPSGDGEGTWDLKEYYVRFWSESQTSHQITLTSRIKYNDVLRCYEGYVRGTSPDDVVARINNCYYEARIKRVGVIEDESA